VPRLFYQNIGKQRISCGNSNWLIPDEINKQLTAMISLLMFCDHQCQGFVYIDSDWLAYQQSAVC